jgi:pre-mRNA 3'-end-processing factor FIP1
LTHEVPSILTLAFSIQAPTQAVKTATAQAGSHAIQIIAPPPHSDGSTASKQVGTTKSQVTLLSGKSYPEVRTSTVDVNANPDFPSLGKPITEVEIDADLAEHEKPWRRPGADTTDYFNYGFDEFTWSTYCLRHKTMEEAIAEQKNENTQFERMFGGAGAGAMMPAMPTMPGMPPNGAAPDMGMAAMMNMPNMQSMQQQMMQYMAENGIADPSEVNFEAFMSHMQSSGGGMMPQQNIPSGPAATQQNFGGGGVGGNWQQGGYGRGKRGRW